MTPPSRRYTIPPIKPTDLWEEPEILEVAERERKHFGRELHDDICQKLAAISLMSCALSRRLVKGNSALATEVIHLSDLLRKTLMDTRTLAQGLNPDWLDSKGLIRALQALADQTNHCVPCRFKCRLSNIRASIASSLQLYRIAQEAVSNALRHADARGIVIGLRCQRGLLILSITDDGRGLSVKRPTGLGMRNLNHRAKMIGATLQIQGEPGRGTQIVCSLGILKRSNGAR